jgi:hypothetical protein
MSATVLKHRITGALYTNTPEDLLHIKKVMRLAASGSIPFEVREVMKQHGWHLLATSSDANQIETAKLLITYSWWARALEKGISKKEFEKFMNDQLAYIDAKLANDKDAGRLNEKWDKYG